LIARRTPRGIAVARCSRRGAQEWQSQIIASNRANASGKKSGIGSGGDVPVDEAAAAFHEAGHAVVAYLLGEEVEFATLDPDQNGPPRVSVKDPAAGDWEARRRHVVIALAGLFSEGNQTGKTNWGGSSHDLDWARHELEVIERGLHGVQSPKAIIDAEIEAAARSAWALIEPNWLAVEALATELLARRNLDGVTVRALLDRTVGERDDG
jgi:hypothetical protein